MIYIIAHEASHADFAANKILGLKRQEWRFISDSSAARGLRDGKFYRVYAARYQPSRHKADDVRRTLGELGLRGITPEIITLP